MSNHTIDDLRRRLFETIDGVRNGTVEIERAKIVSDLCQVIVNTAKVEVDFLRATDGSESNFLSPSSNESGLGAGITGRTVHRIS